MIIATMGSNPFSTMDLLQKIDDIAPNLGEDVMIQTGPSKFVGKNTKCFSFVSETEIKDIFDRASLFIGLPNVGTMLNAITRSRPIVMVFDLPEYRIPFRMKGEAMEISEYVRDRGWGVICTDISKLEECINEARKLEIAPYVPNTDLADYLGDYLADFDRTRKSR